MANPDETAITSGDVTLANGAHVRSSAVGTESVEDDVPPPLLDVADRLPDEALFSLLGLFSFCGCLAVAAGVGELGLLTRVSCVNAVIRTRVSIIYTHSFFGESSSLSTPLR